MTKSSHKNHKCKLIIKYTHTTSKQMASNFPRCTYTCSSRACIWVTCQINSHVSDPTEVLCNGHSLSLFLNYARLTLYCEGIHQNFFNAAVTSPCDFETRLPDVISTISKTAPFRPTEHSTSYRNLVNATTSHGGIQHRGRQA